MGDIINLRRARKAKARDEAVQAAAENRARHGRTKEQRESARQGQARAERSHEGHRLNDGE